MSGHRMMLGTEAVIEVTEWDFEGAENLDSQALPSENFLLKDVHNDARNTQLTWVTLSQMLLLFQYLFLFVHFCFPLFGHCLQYSNDVKHA